MRESWKALSAGLLATLLIQARGTKCAPKGRFNEAATAAILLELLDSKSLANRRPIYLKSLESYCGRFPEKHPRLKDVTSQDIETWLSQFPGAWTRATWLNRINTLCAFAKKRGHIEENPCECIDSVFVDHKPPVILSVDQSRSLLASCPAVCKPYLVLAMFAGIRPDEIHRLNWVDVNLESGTVRVDGKTRRRRIVPLEPIAVELLRAHPICTGLVSPSLSTIRRWKLKARPILGGKWTADVLRHTAASYLLALHKDAGKVSTMLGNSPGILLSHYHEPVTQTDCQKFWAL